MSLGINQPLAANHRVHNVKTTITIAWAGEKRRPALLTGDATDDPFLEMALTAVFESWQMTKAVGVAHLYESHQ